MKSKPIIGIVSKYKETKNDRYDALIRDEVKNAVIDNGGIAIGILTPETEVNFFDQNDQNIESFLTDKQKQDLIAQIKLCDGIIIQGGPDSLKYEIWIAKHTFDNDIPTLGICAGQNNMVRAVGGTIKKLDNAKIKKHNQKWTDEVHSIFIDKKSKFYKIVKCEQMVVNSRHKNVVDNPTSNYVISAVCDDGFPDVLEAPNKKFNLAVRFHPESLYKKYKTHNEIFKAFISACKKP